MSYKRLSASCLNCKRSISLSNFTKHLDSKRCHPTQKVPKYKICPYCNKTTKQTRHPAYCEHNPNRKILKGGNQFTKAKKSGITYEISDETRKKLSESSSGRLHKQETKKKLSLTMLAIAKTKPESYAGRYNRGHVKEVVCSNGMRVLGSWEHKFVEFCLDYNISIEQPNVGFSYIWNGERVYYPDFFLPFQNLYVEIKGMYKERDLAKWDSLRKTHNKKLLVIDKNNIYKLEEIMVPHVGNAPTPTDYESAVPL
jgi:hypothetical protein